MTKGTFHDVCSSKATYAFDNRFILQNVLSFNYSWPRPVKNSSVAHRLKKPWPKSFLTEQRKALDHFPIKLPKRCYKQNTLHSILLYQSYSVRTSIDGESRVVPTKTTNDFSNHLYFVDVVLLLGIPNPHQTHKHLRGTGRGIEIEET